MNFDKTYGFFDSSDGIDRIAYYIYVPHTAVKAVVQVSHGMCEYLERYEHFINFLCKNGIAVLGHDHLGHGHSVDSKDDYGYFAPENGWHCIVKDTHKMTHIAKEHYPDLPLFLIGHSMGSLIVRAYMAKYADKIDGIVLLGTTGTNSSIDAGILLAKALCKIKGDKYRSVYLEKLLFGISNMKINNKRTEFDWVSSDKNVIGKYISDDNCNFIFTSRGFLDLFYLQAYVSQKTWAGKIPKDLPVLIMSGEDDPVGRYGAGPRNVFHRLCDAEIKNLEINIYEKARHEIINEKNKDEVYSDILEWISKKLK